MPADDRILILASKRLATPLVQATLRGDRDRHSALPSNAAELSRQLTAALESQELAQSD